MVLPIEDVKVGDHVEFFGAGDRGGFRRGEVTKVFPRLRVLRLEKRAVVVEGGKEVLFWRTTIHESRLIRVLEAAGA